MATTTTSDIPNIESIVSGLLEIMRKHTKTSGEGWTAETRMEEAGIDSFDFVELIFSIEDLYSININFNSNSGSDTLSTVGDVARFVQATIERERVAA